ncbi:Metallopeptidase, catalytic domain protein, partial [Metarhizium majus ARSEF 297]
MRLIGFATALNPASVVALSISGRGSSLDTRAWPSFAQTYESLAELGVLNGTGCIVNGDEQAEQRRADTDRSCANQQQQVDAALAQCAELAKRAEQDTKDGTSPLFEQYFKTNDANARNEVAQSYAEIAAGCGHDGNQPIRVECRPTEPCFLPQRGGELFAMAQIRSGGPASIRLCRQAFNMPAGRQRRQNQGQGQGCTNDLTNMGELLVHEMAHATVAAKDITYGKRNCKSLSTGQGLNNADNYALLAADIAKNCGAGPGNGNRPPNNGNNGDNESPNGGNGRPPPGFPGNNGGPSNRPPTNGPPNNGPPNDFPDFNNQFPNGNNFQPGGNNNNRFPNNKFPNNRPPNDFPDFDNQFPNGNNFQPGGNNNNGFPNNGPPNNFPDFDNQFPNNNNFQPGGNNNNGPLNRPPTNGPPNNFPGFDNQISNNNNFQPGGSGPSNNGPPSNFPDFDNKFSNNNNFQPGGNGNDAGLDPSIISSIVGSNDFEVVPAGK